MRIITDDEMEDEFGELQPNIVEQGNDEQWGWSPGEMTYLTAHADRVWTLSEEDGQLWYVSGFAHVNRLFHVLTEHPHNGECIVVEVDGGWERGETA